MLRLTLSSSKTFKITPYLILFSLLPFHAFSQQVVDYLYYQKIEKPEYENKKGPIVYIDQGHNNFHTRDVQFKPFTEVLLADGYNVLKFPWRIIPLKLSAAKILVIANAVSIENVTNWELPTPSAFAKREIDDLAKWVFEGGSLFLIADHMPMAGAATELAAKFGFEFSNGFVFHNTNKETANFSKSNGSLVENSITNGRNKSENVSKIVTYIGQGFKIPADATPILVFDENYENLIPEKAWEFSKKTTKSNAKGLIQGAYKKYGKGRIVVFGEAAMFTAQLAGPDKLPAGMNHPSASENYKLLLNIIHWLDGKYD